MKFLLTLVMMSLVEEEVRIHLRNPETLLTVLLNNQPLSRELEEELINP